MPLHKAIFFDRDGVLNDAIIRDGLSYPPDSVNAITIPADAKKILALLKADGFLLLGITNQPDVARGKTTRDAIEAINRSIQQTLGLDEIYTCYHDNIDHCACRKPKPGMLLKAAEQYAIDLSKSVMIGDRWRDIDAGHAAGCKTIWLRPAILYQEKLPTHPDATVYSLTEAYEWISASLQIF